ncbi:hypothetical protein K470DRAFT_200930, partial [Piedraia hortae CBS 480.64]
MDTRTPSPGQDAPADLSAEVATLSTKLVNAINHQTNLDDSLQSTRLELEKTQQELARVRQEATNEVAQLRQELSRERARRDEAERQRKQTEGELENLTTALFEEANTMVAAARKEVEAVERRNGQLRTQLSDTEVLLASQTEQLHGLKGVMEQLERASETERDSSLPATPVRSSAQWDADPSSPLDAPCVDVTSYPPLHFAQFLVPALRFDVAAYHEFEDLLAIGRRSGPHSRHTSGGTPSTSSPSLPGGLSFTTSSSPTPNNPSSVLTPLKDSKFYKRSLEEDIEPTLRLDLAPGLTFLSRRTVLASLLSGSLVVEPFTPQERFYSPVFACALCGEGRKDEVYLRKHRLRTNEDEGAQRYPLCDYCLNRVRVAGDFVGFLRMVRDGHWKAEGEEEQHSAWEECVRLRERMFWARIGGGVV